ncbi:hypothetical protein PVA44_07665 (plasmid) [Entomospira nematocerorum]|uniref:Uncharacterized protein n=1 Tax=Entomospira nematocerorum TaxID=2719987 RepID=A0A968GDI4_9SPIO|nr:hypothetical protein [Entomospira nematocera]NIZ47789.1 hypothetical protein [Entomospira nematocera]WDI34767.1 hypothetical protein PVA44_07665 [Entomospira nematocera]
MMLLREAHGKIVHIVEEFWRNHWLNEKDTQEDRLARAEQALREIQQEIQH